MTMPTTPPDDADKLSGLRREIDEIDAQMHALLQQRARVIGQLVQAKKTSTGTAFRPDREAAMMQKMAERHRGELPFLTVAHIWRVIISTFTQLQAPYRVYLGGGDPALRDLARYQFGFSTPLVSQTDRQTALQALGQAPANLALVPCGGDTDWWTPALEHGSHVIAVLPDLAGSDSESFVPALVFCTNTVSVSDLPQAVVALACEHPGPLAQLIEQSGVRVLSGPVAQGTRALALMLRADLDAFAAMAEGLDVAITDAGGAAIPADPARHT